MAETQVWLRSSVKFAQDLLGPQVAGYPDLVLPIIESISRYDLDQINNNVKIMFSGYNSNCMSYFES